MRKHYRGLDMLRGLGIFILLWMHTAFYYFDGLYDLDFDNPPAIVTVIGLMLMFAGIFGMISGTAHVIQFHRKTVEGGYGSGHLLRYNTANGLLMLSVAWLYFVFTGPGLADMANRRMNNSVLVELIRNGRWAGFSLERFLYVDSLVMIGLNLLLLGPIFLLVRRCKRPTATPWLLAGLVFFALSLLRIPLYAQYVAAVDEGRTGTMLLLNWLVNKNNPILPYLSFGLFGGWLGSLLVLNDWKRMVRQVLPVGLVLFLTGVFLYVLLPDTMLQRSIDTKWFAIMTAQLGLFPLLILLALRLFDFSKEKSAGRTVEKGKASMDAVSIHPIGVAGPTASPVRFDVAGPTASPARFSIASPTAFIQRFGVAGLTAFFLESLLSALIFRVLRLFRPTLSFDLAGSLLYGFCLATLWGCLLALWERKQYRWGLEDWMCRVLARFGHSEKQDKLGGHP